jgi:hypothetical protein
MLKRNPYYIQRLNKPQGTINPFSFGGGLVNGGLSPDAMNILKSVFSFDYMGSAEFEWGAVPTALKALVNSKLTFASKTLKDTPVYIICPIAILEDVKDWLDKEIKGENGHTKERVGLREAVNKDRYAGTIVGWLRIEDDRRCEEPFMFFTNEEMFNNTCKVFGLAVPEMPVA